MKRLFLAAAVLAGTFGMTHANILTVHNLTACTYTLSTSAGTYLTVGPGVSTFTSTPDIIATKIVYNMGGPNEVSIGVGIPPGFLLTPTARPIPIRRHALPPVIIPAAGHSLRRYQMQPWLYFKEKLAKEARSMTGLLLF